MQKIIKINNEVIAILSNGSSFKRDDLTEEEFEQLKSAETDEDVLSIMMPSYKELNNKREEVIGTINRVKDSNVLFYDKDAVYWKEISSLSVPKKLVEAILKAESNEDKIKLETYKNFWTLMSLNTNKECRDNLFWFLNRNGLVIERDGFFVAYRNVCKTNEDGVYTDYYTHKFKIKIGEMVTMNRDECDSDSNITCSRGLHLANHNWLKENYYGNIGLVCLCNPADVTAVPHEDHYGKLRTCAYLPIAFAEYDNTGNVVPYKAEDGFLSEYVPKVIYEGLMGTEEDSTYKIKIPDIPDLNSSNINNMLLDIAREAIIHRNL